MGLGPSGRKRLSKGISDMVYVGLLAVVKNDFHDIVAPGRTRCAQLADPVACTPFNELLLVVVDGIEWADGLGADAGLDLDEEQQLSIAGNDVDLAALGSPVIAREDLAALASQPTNGDALAVAPDPLRVTRFARRISQAAGRVEPRAETSDDGGGKGRGSEALQDAALCHIPDAWQSHKRGTPNQFQPSVDRG